MKNAYRMFKRRNRPFYYIQNYATGEQSSLGTADKKEARKLLDAKNQERQTPALNHQRDDILNTFRPSQLSPIHPDLTA